MNATPRRWTRDEILAALESKLDELALGQVNLHDLPQALAAWYFAGWAEGRASQAAELEKLRAETNLLHFWLTPANRRNEEVERRLLARLETLSASEHDHIGHLLEQLAKNRTDQGQQLHSIRADKRSADKGQNICQQEETNSGNQDPNSRQSAPGLARAA